MDFTVIAGALAVGFGAGVLSGAFGVGGAILTTPGLRAFGVGPIQAVGSTIPAILPAALSGAYRYARAGMVDRRVGLTCGITGAALAVPGARASDFVDARWLMVATAGLLVWSGVSSISKAMTMPSRASLEAAALPAKRSADADARDAAGNLVTDRATHPESTDRSADRIVNPVADLVTDPDIGADSAIPRRSVSTFALMQVGAAAGFVAGLLGVGGGVIMMPLFTNVLRMPVKVAIGSSLVAVAIFSVPAMIAHAYLGHIEWTVALLLTVGTVPGANIGSRLSIAASARTMRLALGGFFCVLAVVFGGSELSAIF